VTRVSSLMRNRKPSDNKEVKEISSLSRNPKFIMPTFFRTVLPSTTRSENYAKGSIAEGLTKYLSSKRNADYVLSEKRLD